MANTIHHLVDIFHVKKRKKKYWLFVPRPKISKYNVDSRSFIFIERCAIWKITQFPYFELRK